MIRIFYMLIVTIPLYSSTLDELIRHVILHSTVLKQSQAQIEQANIKRKENSVQAYGSLDLVGD